MSDALGEQLLANCINTVGFAKASACGFNEEMLRAPCYDAWNFCIDLIRKGEYPGKDEVASKFGISLIVSEEPIESLVRRITKRAYINEIKPIFDEALRLVASGNPEDATDAILQVARLRAKYAPKRQRPMSYRSDFEERIVLYRILKESAGIVGAVSRWATLNRTIKGWQDGFFHVIAALTSTGKSWSLMIIADDLLAQGRKPLIVSTEMAPIRLQFRLDCVHYKVPFPLVRDGKLSDIEEEAYMKSMFEDSLKTDGDVIFVGKHEVKSVTDVQLLAQDLGVTDVLIDGGYRLSKSREWGDQAAVVQELQHAAEESGIPWIVTTQLGDSTEKGGSFDKKAQNKWNTRYAKEWLIDPDVVITMSQPPDLKLIKRMQWSLEKWRDGDGPKAEFQTAWDPATMDYHEIEESETVDTIADSLVDFK